MKKKHLLICNKSLLLLMPIVVSSSILLESLHGNPFCGLDNVVWTWLHVVTSSILLVLVVWHIQLNWKNASEWYHRLKKHHSKGFKGMAISFLLTFFTGLISIPVWLSHGHAGIGGLHGKIGFICAFFMLGHIINHWKWYSNNTQCKKTKLPKNKKNLYLSD